MTPQPLLCRSENRKFPISLLNHGFMTNVSFVTQHIVQVNTSETTVRDLAKIFKSMSVMSNGPILTGWKPIKFSGWKVERYQ